MANLQASETDRRCKRVLVLYELLMPRYTGFLISSCLDTRQPGNVFKKLDTRQSEILTDFLEMARLIPLRT